MKIISYIIILNFIFANNLDSSINNILANEKNQNKNLNIWIYFSDKGPINIKQEIDKIILTANNDQIKRRDKVKKELFD